MGNNSLTNNTQCRAERQKSTFVVKVEYCQRGTWQGKVIWAEENRTVRFRSALELLRLINEVVGSEQAEEKADIQAG
ncbi:hypothetical protein [Butyrivibrio sp. AE2032]|uniref:hypothetical protein n=1 Tax=Butyrivibrio sp. AE2032 TaxID=1458463 RepID=UPI000550A8D1|nr:hypothetical protein [Butyrivibrio sp. AE2032]